MAFDHYTVSLFNMWLFSSIWLTSEEIAIFGNEWRVFAKCLQCLFWRLDHKCSHLYGMNLVWCGCEILAFCFRFLACWREGETRKENGKLQNFWCISDWGSAILLQGRQRGCFRPSEPIPQMMNVCEKLWGGEVCHKPDMLGMPTTKLFCCSFL